MVSDILVLVSTCKNSNYKSRLFAVRQLQNGLLYTAVPHYNEHSGFSQCS